MALLFIYSSDTLTAFSEFTITIHENGKLTANHLRNAIQVVSTNLIAFKNLTTFNISITDHLFL